MEIINLHHPIDTKAIHQGPIVLALGFFDGVHKGHQKVLKAARQEASKRNIPLAAMTFNMSARFMFQEEHPKELRYLTTLPEKKRLMQHFGVEILYIVQMTSAFAKLAPQLFVDQYIVGLQAKTVVAGFDYTYGKKDIANMANLGDYGQGRFHIIEVPKVEENGVKVGTTEIRQTLVETGDVATAKKQLGYPYFFTGIVIHGEKRGRELGYPTANLMIDETNVVPKVGVYAVECLINGDLYKGMASIGYNITFGDNRERTVEIYLLDYSLDIYGEEMTVYWHKYLRNELKFDSADELIEQMNKDEEMTREYFKENSPYKEG
ncbi:riboflavin biosynthesis protein RibF [Aerococcus kribbianus]|uniref:Riboflavin biosynthesis protein n=1 Tax=Aerococcus kribbianus TaxID=2999064 RepID=A0A9X3FR26_9LACT|nr:MULTISPECIES: riboflavin biosynthesis protein RibF [unclassified Aerococcus]MCZ0716777.1 riboflavin biosynthesis protein RibF [Aerococcus sp. YH-aer221]MCZ0725065.1 riboflavin biosynthesis protein RibF [Aerococcus sp. YH-aer222]